MGFEQQSWDLSLKAGIGVSGPGFESQGQDLSLKAGIWASTVRYQFQKEGGGTDRNKSSKDCTWSAEEVESRAVAPKGRCPVGQG